MWHSITQTVALDSSHQLSFAKDPSCTVFIPLVYSCYRFPSVVFGECFLILRVRVSVVIGCL